MLSSNVTVSTATRPGSAVSVAALVGLGALTLAAAFFGGASQQRRSRIEASPEDPLDQIAMERMDCEGCGSRLSDSLR